MNGSDAGVERIDAVLYSHDHADHSHGIDDLREINRLMLAPVPVYATPETLNGLGKRFGYCFEPLKPGDIYYRPVLSPHAISGTDSFNIYNIPVTIYNIPVTPFLQDHGYIPTVGYRFGNFAYSTDVLRLDEAAFAALEGITDWVVDCVRLEPHPVHSHLANTLEWIDRVKPRRAWLTHMNNTLDYDTLVAMLPPGVMPAHDGLVIKV